MGKQIVTEADVSKFEGELRRGDAQRDGERRAHRENMQQLRDALVAAPPGEARNAVREELRAAQQLNVAAERRRKLQSREQESALRQGLAALKNQCQHADAPKRRAERRSQSQVGSVPGSQSQPTARLQTSANLKPMRHHSQVRPRAASNVGCHPDYPRRRADYPRRKGPWIAPTPQLELPEVSIPRVRVTSGQMPPRRPR